MAPEAPANLVVLDVCEADNGFAFDVSRWDFEGGGWLWVLWSADTCPEEWLPAAGGAVCVAAPPEVRRAEYRAVPRAVRDPRRLLWTDFAEPPLGLMLVVLLPEGYILDDQLPNDPTPIEAKVFNGRMALHWRLVPASRGRVEAAWTIRRMPEGQSLRDACVEVNERSLASALPDLPPPPRADVQRWRAEASLVHHGPPGDVRSIQAETVNIYEAPVMYAEVSGDMAVLWEQHSSEIPLDRLADELRAIRAALVKRGDDSRELSEALEAAEEGNGPGALAALKRVGEAMLNVASSVGADVASAAIRATLGLP